MTSAGFANERLELLIHNSQIWRVELDVSDDVEQLLMRILRMVGSVRVHENLRVLQHTVDLDCQRIGRRQASTGSSLDGGDVLLQSRCPMWTPLGGFCE